MAQKPQLIPSGLVAGNITEPQIRDVQTVPWAGARIYQATNSSIITSRVHMTGATNVVYDTHGFYSSGGTFRVPFTGIYDIRVHALMDDDNVIGDIGEAEAWSNNVVSITGATRQVHAIGVQAQWDNTFLNSLEASNTALLDQGLYVMFFVTGTASGTVFTGGYEHAWMSIHYLGPPRQSQVG